MIGYYNYTVILTYLSLACAVVGICFSLGGNNQMALILLLASGCCDMFDGSVARTRKRTQDEIAFGAHIDSLCDLVAFGVAPAFILYGLGGRSPIYIVLMVCYVLAAVIRLAYFDVQEAKIVKSGEKRDGFLGLPVTNSALILPGLMAINSLIRLDDVIFYAISLFAVMIAFITPFKMKKLYLPALLIPAAFGVALFVILIIFGGVLNVK